MQSPHFFCILGTSGPIQPISRLFWYFMVHIDASLNGPLFAYCNINPWQCESQSSIRYRMSKRKMHLVKFIARPPLRSCNSPTRCWGTLCYTLLNSLTLDCWPTTFILMCSLRRVGTGNFPPLQVRLPGVCTDTTTPAISKGPAP